MAKHRITALVENRAAKVVCDKVKAALRIVKGNTPVVTGATKAAWQVTINGSSYYEEDLTPSLFKGIRTVTISNPKDWIDELDDRRAIMSLSKIGIELEIRRG